MFAAGVKRISASFHRQRMHKHAAGSRISRHHELLPCVEVFWDCSFVRGSRPGGQFLKARSLVVVAFDTARVAGALSEKDGLNAVAEKFET